MAAVRLRFILFLYLADIEIKDNCNIHASCISIYVGIKTTCRKVSLEPNCIHQATLYVRHCVTNLEKAKSFQISVLLRWSFSFYIFHDHQTFWTEVTVMLEMSQLPTFFCSLFFSVSVHAKSVWYIPRADHENNHDQDQQFNQSLAGKKLLW